MAIVLISLPLFPACSSDDDTAKPIHRTYDSNLSEELVAEQVARAAEFGDSLFNVCESPEELETYAEQIRSLPGLESVEFDNQGMTIIMNNFIPISYIYPMYPDGDNEVTYKPMVGVNASIGQLDMLTRTLDTKNQHLHAGVKSICIVDQLSHDEGFSWYVLPRIDDLKEKANSLGINVEVLSNSVTADFFESKAYNYDILLILAHGGYIERLHSHSICTSEKIHLTREQIMQLIRKKDLNSNAIRYVKETHTRFFKKVEESVPYLCVTDIFISNTKGHYSEERKNKAVVFSAACKSMKDNPNMAYAFIDKGAAIYVGFNETQSIGIASGHNFVLSLLSGNTLKETLDETPVDLREQDKQKKDSAGKIVRWTAKRDHRYGSTKNIERTCYVSIVTDDAGVVSETATSLYSLFGDAPTGSIVLQGTARMLYATDNTYGFCIGKKSDLSDGKPVLEIDYMSTTSSSSMQYGGAIAYNPRTNTVTFCYVLTKDDIGDGGELYYCAYMRNSNASYCYGEIKSIETIVEDNINGELGIFELKGSVKLYTYWREGSTDYTVRTFDRDGFWLTCNGQSLENIYTEGISRDKQGRITEGRFEGGFESYEYDNQGRITKYGYLYYDGGNGISYYYSSDGLLERAVDEPRGMDAEYYDTDEYHYKDYVLDSHNNWISRYVYTGFSGYTEKRTIIYYE